jgi:hypothetical protein
MNRRLAFRGGIAALVLGSAAGLGCYTGSSTDTNRLPDPNGDVSPTDPSGPGGPGGPAGDGGAATHTPRGLPCDVAALVATKCMECHGAVPSGGAQNRLLTYEDFTALPSDPTFKSVAELAVFRMKSSTRPMPPDGTIDQPSIATLENWVKAGLPRGSCGETSSPDGGGSDNPPPPDDDGGDSHQPGTSFCHSGLLVPEPEDPSALMRPGEACLTCHHLPEEQGPDFPVIGTVYPTDHEPDDCRGVPDATVVIVDASGFTHTLTTNASGNFYTEDPVPLPYRALVSRGGELREMQTPQWNGNCNFCHTEWGSNGAPGRINIP